MKTIPRKKSDVKSSCSSGLFVHALAARPNELWFPCSIAWAASPMRKIEATGPKTFLAVSWRDVNGLEQLAHRRIRRHQSDFRRSIILRPPQCLDLIVHTLQNLLCRERTNFSSRIHRIANLQCTHPVNELIEKLIVNFVRNEKSLGRDARLSGVNGAGFDRRAATRSQIPRLASR